MAANRIIRPALIVVDMQEDFCPPHGSLAVQGGRDITSLINTLLAKPGFIVRILTKDYHPKDHISFARNHPGPDNHPFTSFVTMKNPALGKKSETKQQQLWPVHCVAGTSGAEIIPEIDMSSEHLVVQKGMRPEVEMYSVFADAFGNCDHGTNAHSVSLDVAATLKTQGVTDVFVVGLAGDYCVKATALDAVKVGFRSWVVEEGTKCVVPASWDATKKELGTAGVSIISMNDPIVRDL
ncbi:Isochorismatase family hydrolase, putative [Penicillium digitatum]|uniref:nicotinamidase n=3 Tax=Penicillium digitatum TaxID=36651 RepID=K9G405_PEND2|nr:Isochorismatase family hydrolase, putative [Penicillium digitatum Pd1]EKV07842.1 Isochorismatase family hydrolase, putative [Penicillium digitatum Pd1]EKV09573.1 Isochorismatase family hydrolase, putative [Penicillium digitatum PHI26]KAG0159049.1 hypothetical protein PDIDSM_6569 [Penicillium digitatum]QQK41459.1 Isochorismatase family hydrolase, putative [Penicillium digitatum]